MSASAKAKADETSRLIDQSLESDYERLIKEKERDLELAAKIGRSLLDQNRELQERNEFLEESLNSSDETVKQLHYQLKQKTTLLNTLAEYDDQHSGNSPSEYQLNFVESLEIRVKELENENNKLKNEVGKLRDFADENQNERVRDYLIQLEKANFKIGKLQLQIGEKNNKCCRQADEIQRLIQEIGRRKDREKTMGQQNEDLQAELGAAIKNHEDLRAEIETLQDKYCDIVAMLGETQEELKTARSDTAQKANSLNSLYDSLASELEASDSGFYSTPMVSARSDQRQRSSQSGTMSPPTLQLELERLNRNKSPIEELNSENNFGASTSTDMECLKLDMSSLNEITTQTDYYDVPSKAILDAVKRSMSAEEKRRARSASHTPQTSMDTTNNHHSIKTSTPRGHSLQQANKTLETFVEEFGSVDGKRRPSCSRQRAVNYTDDDDIKDPEHSYRPKVSKRETKTYRNASCSPIRLDRLETHPDEPTPRGPSTNETSSVFVYSGATSYMPNSSAEDTTTSHLLSSTSPSSSSDNEEDTPRSSDSLQNYNGPRFGQPGSPGSKDLEFSLRKMQFHKKLDEEYERFRQHRGLEPRKKGVCSGEAKPTNISKQSEQFASLANRVGAMANSNGSTTFSPTRSKKNNTNSQSQSKDSKNNNSVGSQRVSTSNSLCIGDQRPKTLNRSSSIGLQMWQHSHLKINQAQRGIDSAVRDRMPLVCGVLWRSVAPRPQQSVQDSSTNQKPSTTLRNQVASMPGASSSQIFNALGLSPVHKSQKNQQKIEPMEYLGKFLNFDTKNDESGSSSLEQKSINNNGSGLSSVLLQSNTNNGNSIIQRSSLQSRRL